MNILLIATAFIVTGLITTSGRKLDRENQAEHVLEVSQQFKSNFTFLLKFSGSDVITNKLEVRVNLRECNEIETHRVFAIDNDLIVRSRWSKSYSLMAR